MFTPFDTNEMSFVAIVFAILHVGLMIRTFKTGRWFALLLSSVMMASVWMGMKLALSPSPSIDALIVVLWISAYIVWAIQRERRDSEGNIEKVLDF